MLINLRVRAGEGIWVRTETERRCWDGRAARSAGIDRSGWWRRNHRSWGTTASGSRRRWIVTSPWRRDGGGSTRGPGINRSGWRGQNDWGPGSASGSWRRTVVTSSRRWRRPGGVVPLRRVATISGRCWRCGMWWSDMVGWRWRSGAPVRRWRSNPRGTPMSTWTYHQARKLRLHIKWRCKWKETKRTRTGNKHEMLGQRILEVKVFYFQHFQETYGLYIMIEWTSF